VDAADLNEWGSEAFDALAAALSAAGLTAAGPYGGLFDGDFFELERSEVTAFVPVPAGAALGTADPPGGVRVLRIPAVEAAVAVHAGAFSEIDRTYAAVGEVVAERAIGTGGPIREYYLVSSADTDDVARHRTEVCWPVFRTGAA
jgi:effector-binding domain-containing protein